MSMRMNQARSDGMRAFCAERACGEDGTRPILPTSIGGRGPEQLAELCPGVFPRITVSSLCISHVQVETHVVSQTVLLYTPFCTSPILCFIGFSCVRGQ